MQRPHFNAARPSRHTPATLASPQPCAASHTWPPFAVYEDCKMSVLGWRLLPTLGRTLLRLAGLLGAAACADHYCRDLGMPAGAAAVLHTAGSGGAAPVVAAAAPPSMFQALQQLLAGRREGRGAAPTLAQQRAPCVQRRCGARAQGAPACMCLHLPPVAQTGRQRCPYICSVTPGV